MIEQSNTYFKCLLKFLTETECLNLPEKNKYWILKYKELHTEIKKSNVVHLPLILPLIYPVFLYNSEGQFLGNFIDYNSSDFSKGINNSDNCQYSSIQKSGFCEFNNYRQIREKCQADHYWPYSLGGPSIIENRILLCRFHNVAKSNSIVSEFWRNYPSWLNPYLERLFNLKSDPTEL